MVISSEEARDAQFSGTKHAYDGNEVEAFRRRVVEALAAHESAPGADDPAELSSTDATQEPGDVAAAQRIRHQAVQLAERMLRDVMGASGDTAGGFTTWQDAAMLRAAAEEEMEFAREEARRLPAMAAAERDAMHARYAKERSDMRAALQRELQESRDAANTEAENISAQAEAEAVATLHDARARSEETQRAAAEEANRLERRIALLHTAVADAEIRFRRLAATAANEIGTLAAIADQDVDTPVPGGPEPSRSAPRTSEPYLASVDLTDEALVHEDVTHDEDDAAVEGARLGRDPDVTFYQRRLAGLRERLEQSGNPPS